VNLGPNAKDPEGNQIMPCSILHVQQP